MWGESAALAVSPDAGVPSSHTMRKFRFSFIPIAVKSPDSLNSPQSTHPKQNTLPRKCPLYPTQSVILEVRRGVSNPPGRRSRPSQVFDILTTWPKAHVRRSRPVELQKSSYVQLAAPND